MGNQVSATSVLVTPGAPVTAAQSALLTSRRAVDLCRVGSCLCQLG